MARLKGILLDLDDTFYEYKKCNELATRKCLESISKICKINIKDAKQNFLKARKQVKKILKNTAAARSRLLYFKKTIELIENRTNIDLALKLENIFWEEYFKRMNLRSNAKKFLELCRRKKLKTIIVTNLTTKEQFLKIRKLGIEKLVDFVITSEEAGIEKPSKKIIQHALKLIKCKKNNVIFIGDKDDYLAAKKSKISFFLISKDSDWLQAMKIII